MTDVMDRCASDSRRRAPRILTGHCAADRLILVVGAHEGEFISVKVEGPEIDAARWAGWLRRKLYRALADVGAMSFNVTDGTLAIDGCGSPGLALDHALALVAKELPEWRVRVIEIGQLHVLVAKTVIGAGTFSLTVPSPYGSAVPEIEEFNLGSRMYRVIGALYPDRAAKGSVRVSHDGDELTILVRDWDSTHPIESSDILHVLVSMAREQVPDIATAVFEVVTL